MPADTKISDLPAATTVGDTDLIPIVQSGTTKRATQNQVCSKIYDGSHVLAADFGARKLYRTTGSDVMIDWSDPGGIIGLDIVNINGLATPDISTLAPATSITIRSSFTSDQDDKIALSVPFRQLIANDGSTVALDWSDPSGAVFFGSVYIFPDGTTDGLSVPQITNTTDATSFIYNSGSSMWTPSADRKVGSQDAGTYFDNSGFHGSGASLTGVSASTVTGTATNDNAAAGNVGEYVSTLKAIGSPVSLSNGTAANIINVSLSAGDWDVEGIASFTETTATVSARSAGISATSATLPTDGSEGYCGVQSTLTSEINSISLTRKRISLTTTTTVYLVGKASFSAGTCGGFGVINARRVR